MKKIGKSKIAEAKRFVKYMVGGNAQFWSGYLAFALFDAVMGIDFWPAKIASYAVGVTVNFVIERYWAFSSKKLTHKQLQTSATRYYSLMFVNFLIDLLIVGGLRELGISPYIGQFISAGFFTVWNYLIFKVWVFGKGKQAKGARA